MTFDATYVLPAPASRIGKPRVLPAEVEHLRIPRNSNSKDTLDDCQAPYSSLSKIHPTVPSRRPSLMSLWWLVYGIVDIHSRISVRLDPTVTA